MFVPLMVWLLFAVLNQLQEIEDCGHSGRSSDRPPRFVRISGVKKWGRGTFIARKIHTCICAMYSCNLSHSQRSWHIRGVRNYSYLVNLMKYLAVIWGLLIAANLNIQVQCCILKGYAIHSVDEWTRNVYDQFLQNYASYVQMTHPSLSGYWQG